MRITPPLLLLLVLCAGAALAGSRVEEGVAFADPAPDGQSDLQGRILFTSNRLGEFEPCACPDIPLGGISQAAALVSEMRDSGVPAFWLDSGNRLFKIDMAMTETEEAERRLRAILITDAGSVAGLDAAGVGRLDLGAGLEYLRLLAQRAAFPVLSANLVDAETGERIFAASVLLRRDDRIVGVTSVLPGDMLGTDFATTDPYKAARTEVASLRDQGAELVVVLSNLGLDKDPKLARASRADLVLGSHSREVTTEGVAAGRAIVGQAGARGRYLGDARWYADGPGRGPHLVVTTTPVYSEAAEHPRVSELVERTLERLADPVLGVPPLRYDSWDDPDFRERKAR